MRTPMQRTLNTYSHQKAHTSTQPHQVIPMYTTTYICSPTGSHQCSRTCTLTQIHTNTHSRQLTSTHTDLYSNTHMFINTLTPVFTHINTRSHQYTLTPTDIYQHTIAPTHTISQVLLLPISSFPLFLSLHWSLTPLPKFFPLVAFICLSILKVGHLLWVCVCIAFALC